MRFSNWYARLIIYRFDALLLLIWLIIGVALRFTNLTAKPPWTDEFSTLVFSLGNSFLGVPLDKLISPEILLQPLIPQPTANLQDVWHHLSSESNHPPMYFTLAHWWMQLFPPEQGLASLWGARALPAIFGVLSIPAIYALGWMTFRSPIVAHLAAGMMTVSPYAVFLAQEVRHYTLAILWVIAGFACFVTAARKIHSHTQLSVAVTVSWVIVNALGIASHYFFVLTLAAQAMVLIILAWQQRGHKGKVFLSPPWPRVYIVMVSTMVSGVVWLPFFLRNRYGGELTSWIQQSFEGLNVLSPFFQVLAAWITMLYLLPVESPNLIIVIASGLVMLIFMIWAMPILVGGLKAKIMEPENRFTTQLLMGVVVSAIALFFIFTYGLRIDLTRGARYHFVYFPAVVLLLGASLAVSWQRARGKKAVILIWFMGLLSAITVVANLGYQKYYRPDLLVELIHKTSQVPVIISTTQTNHAEIGEMMGIARELMVENINYPSILFLLARKAQAKNTLDSAVQSLPRPFDLWLVEFDGNTDTGVKECVVDSQSLPQVNGYDYKLYHCN